MKDKIQNFTAFCSRNGWSKEDINKFREINAEGVDLNEFIKSTTDVKMPADKALFLLESKAHSLNKEPSLKDFITAFEDGVPLTKEVLNLKRFANLMGTRYFIKESYYIGSSRNFTIDENNISQIIRLVQSIDTNDKHYVLCEAFQAIYRTIASEPDQVRSTVDLLIKFNEALKESHSEYKPIRIMHSLIDCANIFTKLQNDSDVIDLIHSKAHSNIIFEGIEAGLTKDQILELHQKGFLGFDFFQLLWNKENSYDSAKALFEAVVDNEGLKIESIVKTLHDKLLAKEILELYNEGSLTPKLLALVKDLEDENLDVNDICKAYGFVKKHAPEHADLKQLARAVSTMIQTAYYNETVGKALGITFKPVIAGNNSNDNKPN